MEADRIAQRMSEEDANWFRQNSIDIGRRDYYSDIDAATEKGLTEGRQEKAVEAARTANAPSAAENSKLRTQLFQMLKVERLLFSLSVPYNLSLLRM